MNRFQMNKFLGPILIMALLSFGFATHGYAETDNQQEAMAVITPEGQNVGTVVNALVDPSGQIAFVILSIGQETGQQNKEVAVPSGAFHYDQERGKLIMNVDREKLTAAPEFKASDLDDPSFAARVYQFFGEAPSWTE